MSERVRGALTFANVTSVLALVFAMGGGAYAITSVPGPGGVIHGCYQKKNGNLRIIAAGKKCHKSEKAITWSQTGPRGPQGLQGPQGVKGDSGPVGPATGPAGGDLTGNYPNPLVATIGGHIPVTNATAAGGALTGAYPNPSIAAAAIGTSQFGTIPAARVTNSGSESVNSSTTTTLTFNTNTYDNDSIHSTSTNTSRLTAPVSGIYEVTGGIEWASGAGNLRIADILKNGSEIAENETSPVAGGHDTIQQVTTQVQLAAGDYVELAGFQDSGSSLFILDNINTFFAIHWLGP